MALHVARRIGRHSGIPPGSVTALLRELAGPPDAGADPWRGILRAGARVGRFQLEREIGFGGFGAVWEATDPDLGRSVALKAVRRSAAAPSERVVREAEAAARLSHPNIVTLFDAGRTEQGPYLVLELLRGETLTERLSRGPLPGAEALQIATGIARGLAYAHAQGVVHRDVTPSNVFLCSDGQVKVLDFGLARAFGSQSPPGGTRGYVAPEQAAGAAEDERADVYSLGVIIHQMVTGCLPAGSAASGDQAVPRRWRERELQALVGKMLAPDPALRPRDASQVLDALSSLRGRGGRSPAGQRRASRLALLSALLAVGAGYLGWRHATSTRGEMPSATGNLDAHRHYFEALHYDDQYQWNLMQTELLEALRADPSFALAHLRLATSTLYYAEPLPGVDPASHLRAAARYFDRLPPHERLVVRAELAWLADRREEADDLYRSALEVRPDKRALLRLAWMRAKAEDMAAGLPLAERALALDPSWAPALDYVAIALVFRGEFARAKVLAQAGADRWPSFLSYGILNGVLLHSGDPAAALPVARRAVELWGRMDLGILGRTLIMLDEFDEAEREAREAWSRGPGYRPDAMLPAILCYRGKLAEARHLADELDSSGRAGLSRQLRALLAAARGDRATLRALGSQDVPIPDPIALAHSLALGGEPEAAARVLETAPPHAARTSGGWRTLTRGLVDAARARERGDLAAARQTLQGLRGRLELPPAHVAAYALGEVCQVQGDDRCALESFTEFRRFHWMGDDAAWAYPRSLYLAAISQDRLGLRPEARATVDHLLAIWSEADPALPLLAQARTLRRRLAAR